MGKYNLLWKVKVLRIRLLQSLLCLIAIQLILKKINDIYILFVGVELPGVNTKQEVAHHIITHERIIAIARQIKVPRRVILDYLRLIILFNGLIKLYPIYF